MTGSRQLCDNPPGRGSNAIIKDTTGDFTSDPASLSVSISLILRRSGAPFSLQLLELRVLLARR